MSSLDVARFRLRNSGLTGSPFETVEEVVRWHGAMQAQDYGPAKWSIAQRSGVADADVDDALGKGRIVRTHVLRPTWHFVAAEDVRWMLALTGPRIARSTRGRFRDLGLDGRTLARCEAAISRALEGGNKLTRRELGQSLEDAGIDVTGQRLPHLLMHCELEALICSGGLSGKQHTYALLDERVGKPHPFERDKAVVELTRRYLASHGPSTVKDLGWWASLTIADIKNALIDLGDEVASETIDGLTLWSKAGNRRAATVRGARLLQTYDEFIVGYTESRFLGDPRADAARAAWGDRKVPPGLVLIDGAIAGHWRRRAVRNSIEVDVFLYEDPTEPLSRALRAEAMALGRSLDREAKIEIAPMP